MLQGGQLLSLRSQMPCMWTPAQPHARVVAVCMQGATTIGACKEQQQHEVCFGRGREEVVGQVLEADLGCMEVCGRVRMMQGAVARKGQWQPGRRGS